MSSVYIAVFLAACLGRCSAFYCGLGCDYEPNCADEISYCYSDETCLNDGVGGCQPFVTETLTLGYWGLVWTTEYLDTVTAYTDTIVDYVTTTRGSLKVEASIEAETIFRTVTETVAGSTVYETGSARMMHKRDADPISTVYETVRPEYPASTETTYADYTVYDDFYSTEYVIVDGDSTSVAVASSTVYSTVTTTVTEAEVTSTLRSSPSDSPAESSQSGETEVDSTSESASSSSEDSADASPAGSSTSSERTTSSTGDDSGSSSNVFVRPSRTADSTIASTTAIVQSTGEQSANPPATSDSASPTTEESDTAQSSDTTPSSTPEDSSEPQTQEDSSANTAPNADRISASATLCIALLFGILALLL